jgi:hypothetical protein
MDDISPRRSDSDSPIYVGQSKLLRYWPGFMVVVGLVPVATGQLLGALVFFVPATLAARVLPWRFAVLESGIALWFPFGKHRYVPKEQLTVRVGLGSTVLLPRRADRFGYPLTDGLVERRRMVLRAVLTEHGFQVAT